MEIVLIYLLIGAIISAVSMFKYTDTIIENFDEKNIEFNIRVFSVILGMLVSALIWPIFIINKFNK